MLYYKYYKLNRLNMHYVRQTLKSFMTKQLYGFIGEGGKGSGREEGEGGAKRGKKGRGREEGEIRGY